MKLKYYLRGMGIGIILTAIVMGFALGGRKTTVSDAEVIERAKVLGMVDPTSGVLTQTSGGENNYDEANTIASGQKLDQKGEEVSQKVDEELSSSSEYVSGLDETTQEGEGQDKTSEGTDTSENTKREVISTTPTRSPEGAKSSEQKASESEDVKPKTETASEEATTSDSASSKTSTEDNKTTEVSNSTSEAENNKAENNKTENNKAEDNKTENNKAEDSKTEDNKTEDNKADSASAQTTTDETVKKNTDTAVTNGKSITIPRGMSSDSVAELLYKEGFVDSARSFNQYLIDKKMDRTVRSGVKTIPTGATYEEIANIICK